MPFKISYDSQPESRDERPESKEEEGKGVSTSPRLVIPDLKSERGDPKAVTTQYLSRAPFGRPREYNLSINRRLADTTYVDMVVNLVIDEITSVDGAFKPKEGVEVTPQVERMLEKANALMENPNGDRESLQYVRRQYLRDLLVLDSAVVEKVFSAAGELRELYARDGAAFTKNPDEFGTFRRAESRIPSSAVVDYRDSKRRNLSQAQKTQVLSREGLDEFSAAYYQYSYNSYGLIQPFGRDELVWMERYPRTHEFYGRSPIRACMDAILVLYNSMRSELDYFNNNNIPKGVGMVKDASQEALESVKDQLMQSQSVKDEFGVRRSHWDMPLINTEIEWQNLEWSPKDLEMITQQKWFSKIVWASFGVNPSEMGFTEDSNRATEIVQSKTFKKRTILPILNMERHHYEAEILREFGDEFKEKLEWSWDIFDVDEETKKYQLYKLQTETGLKTINEVRETEGLDSVEYGDEPLNNAGGVDPVSVPEPTPDVEDKAGVSEQKTVEPEFGVGDKVRWSWQGEPVHGIVAEVGDEFTVSGNTITGGEDEPVYLIDEYDENGEVYREGNVAKPESSLQVSRRDLPSREEAKARVAEKLTRWIEEQKDLSEEDRVPPKGAQENAEKVLRWKEEHGDEVTAMTETGWRRARQLASGEALSEETIEKMAQFNRHRSNSDISEEYRGEPWKDNGYVAWLGWGGDVGVDWAIRKSEDIQEQEEEEEEGKALTGMSELSPKEGEQPSSYVERVTKKLLEDAKERLLRDLENVLGEGGVEEKRMPIERVTENLGEYFDVESLRDLVVEAVKEAYRVEGDEASQLVDENFVPSGEALDFLSRSAFEYIQDLTEETRNDLRGELERGFINGEGIDELSDRVSSVMDASASRAEAIARTEINRAENQGRLQSVKDSKYSDVARKYIEIQRDGRTSEISKAMAEKYGGKENSIPVSEAFEVTVDGKKVRGQAPPFHVNDRDRMITFIPEDAVLGGDE